MTGTIKKLLKDKKCGFIKGQDGMDYFFHSNALKNIAYADVYEGQEVTAFEESETPKGLRAEDVYV